MRGLASPRPFLGATAGALYLEISVGVIVAGVYSLVLQSVFSAMLRSWVHVLRQITEFFEDILLPLVSGSLLFRLVAHSGFPSCCTFGGRCLCYFFFFPVVAQRPIPWSRLLCGLECPQLQGGRCLCHAGHHRQNPCRGAEADPHGLGDHGVPQLLVGKVPWSCRPWKFPSLSSIR